MQPKVLFNNVNNIVVIYSKKFIGKVNHEKNNYFAF